MDVDEVIPDDHAASFRCEPDLMFQSRVQEDKVVVPDMLINVLFRETETVRDIGAVSERVGDAGERKWIFLILPDLRPRLHRF